MIIFDFFTTIPRLIITPKYTTIPIVCKHKGWCRIKKGTPKSTFVAAYTSVQEYTTLTN